MAVSVGRLTLVEGGLVWRLVAIAFVVTCSQTEDEPTETTPPTLPEADLRRSTREVRKPDRYGHSDLYRRDGFPL